MPKQSTDQQRRNKAKTSETDSKLDRVFLMAEIIQKRREKKVSPEPPAAAMVYRESAEFRKVLNQLKNQSDLRYLVETLCSFLEDVDYLTALPDLQKLMFEAVKALAYKGGNEFNMESESSYQALVYFLGSIFDLAGKLQDPRARCILEAYDLVEREAVPRKRFKELESLSV